MQSLQATTLLLVDRHALVRSGISLLLNSYPDFRVIGQAGSGEEAVRLAQVRPPDVVIADIDLPGTTGTIELIKIVRRVSPATRFIVLTNSIQPPIIQEVLHEGVIGYVLKSASPDELAQAIRAVHRGIPALSAEVTQVLIDQSASPSRALHHLTSREQQVLQLMARGWNNQQIAIELNISLSTVQFHIGNIFSKLQVRNRTEAAAFALRHQLDGDQARFSDAAPL